MANIKSAIKRIGTSEVRHQHNAAMKSNIASTRKKLFDAIAGSDKTQGQELFSDYCSILDRAVKRGTIKANNANRRKSRAAHRLAEIA